MPLASTQHTQHCCVYEAAQALNGIRCGDPVDVEWDKNWYAGIVTDITSKGNLAISYLNGDFEEDVPESAVRIRQAASAGKVPPSTYQNRPKDKDPKRLSQAANQGDIGLMLEALRDGLDPHVYDEFGYTPLHWAASPDEGMPGDTVSRRKCIAVLAKICDVNTPDTTPYGLRGVQHSVSRNFVGCLKTFVHVGADLSGTVNWAVHTRAHAVLRELLRLGVPSVAIKEEWEGCTPFMLASGMNDVYCLKLLVETIGAIGGQAAVRASLNALQAHPKIRASALHHAADAGADTAITFLLEHNADPTTCNAKSEPPLVVARKRAAAAESGPNQVLYAASLRCAEILEDAVSKLRDQQRAEVGMGLNARRCKTRKVEGVQDAMASTQARSDAAPPGVGMDTDIWDQPISGLLKLLDSNPACNAR